MYKLHLIINHESEIIAFRITSANVNDRKPIPDMIQGNKGKLIGDKGYISKKLSKILLEQGVQLITKIKKNMDNKLMSIYDKWLLHKRALIESVHNLLKNQNQIEHHRHRSRLNFLNNLLSGLAAYCLNPNKPKLHFPKHEVDQITQLLQTAA